MAQTNPPDNTLRLDSNELSRLLSELDGPGPGAGAAKRAFRRWEFRQTSVRVDIQQMGGAVTSLKYACRNLSATGISLIHSSYVHVGSTCVIYLPKANGTLAGPIEGKVVRCRHCKGRIHEIGIQFVKQVDFKELLNLDPFESRFAIEGVDPQKLSGKLLHIDDSAMDRRLLRHHLQETQLSVIATETGLSGLERAREGFDVIVTDFDLPDIKGAELLQTLRNDGVTCPIIVVSADSAGAARVAARENRANAFLAKPFGKEILIRAIAEFLLAEDNPMSKAAGSVSKAAAADSLATECVSEIHSYATTLRSLTGDPASATATIAEIRSAAKSLAFHTVLSAADAALSADASEFPKAAAHLVACCMRMCPSDVKMAA